MESLGQKIFYPSYLAEELCFSLGKLRLPFDIQVSLFLQVCSCICRVLSILLCTERKIEKELGCMQITALRCASQVSFCLVAQNRGNTKNTVTFELVCSLKVLRSFGFILMNSVHKVDIHNFFCN